MGLPRTAGAWCVLGAVALTLLWLPTRSLAPPTGLTRSYSFRGSTVSVVAEHVTDVDLAFLDEQNRPVRNYRVRWEGIWFSPRAERVDFFAGADDGVVVRVDGEIVLERAVGMRTASSTVQFEAGAHRFEIDHWQLGGGRYLNVAWASAGGVPAPLGPGRLFPEDPGVVGYGLAVASLYLEAIVPLVWVGVAAFLLGRMAWRELSGATWQELRARLGTVTFPALLGPSQILLFGTGTIHATNETEFLVSFWNLAPIWIWLLVPLAAGLAGIGVVLPARWFPRYVAVLATAGMLLWVQGNLLVADYGLLDGSGIDLAAHAWRTPFEIGLYVGMIALAVAFGRAVTHAAPLGSALLMALQTAVLLLPAADFASAAPAGPGGGARWSLPPAALHEVSRTRNVVHIVLDMFPSQVFAGIVAADRPAFDRDWSGFTFFADHLGAFRTTKGSMPAMFSGVAYRNETAFDDFRARIERRSVFHAFGQQGWRVRVATSYWHPYRTGDGLWYSIPAPYGSYRDYTFSSAARMLDLSLFRHAPQVLKAGVYRDQQWLLQQWFAERRQLEQASERSFGDTRFLLDFARRLTLSAGAPVYTFLHLMSPHLPIVVDADCTYLGGPLPVDENYAAQARCALAGVRAVLDRLRVLGIYDRSAIVVTSDHGLLLSRPHALPDTRSPAGNVEWVRQYATPLLAIKPVGAEGPLKTSYAPTHITDLPATLLDLAGLPNTLGGVSALALDPAMPRERVYAHHSWGGPGSPNTHTSPYYDVLHLFAVDGRVTDPGAWRYRRAVFEPTGDRAVQRRAHASGLTAVEPSEPGRQPVYRTEEYAVLYVAPDATRLAFDVRNAPDATFARQVVVRVDGRFVSRIELTGDAWRTFDAPLDRRAARSDPFCVELLVSPSRTDVGGTRRGMLLRGDF